MNCIEGHIKANREAATRARQLSTQMSVREDRERILAFAAALDVKTDALERKLASASPPSVIPTGAERSEAKWRDLF
jgi:hypothetical protein